MLQGWICLLNDLYCTLFVSARQVGNCMNWTCFYTRKCLRPMVA
jgi:hypothetical protein